MQEDILPSVKKFLKTVKLVKIDYRRIDKLSSQLTEKNLKTSEINIFSRGWTKKQIVNIVSLCNCLNFSFWAGKGEKKWAVKIRGEILDGAIAFLKTMEEKILEGVPLLNAKFLAKITPSQLSEILKGDVEIPLLPERTKCLNEAGKSLLRNFDGDFVNVLEKANRSAVKFVNLLINYFPSFNDFTIVDKLKVEFHKRAQLNVKMIADALENKGLGGFKDLDKLTIFADYKIPQVLRGLGILSYGKSLADKIDNLEEIPAGSREEAEIRASAVWAAEEIKQRLKPRIPWITSARLDSYFWLISQKKSPDDKPYHRTRTIFY